MSTLMQVYCATLAPAALIGLFVGVYLYTLPATGDEPYGVDDYAAPVEAAPPAARRLTLRQDRPTADRVEHLPPSDSDAGAPMYYALMARMWLREIAARQYRTVQTGDAR